MAFPEALWTDPEGLMIHRAHLGYVGSGLLFLLPRLNDSGQNSNIGHGSVVQLTSRWLLHPASLDFT